MKVAFITGGHSFDLKNLYDAFQNKKAYPDADFYIQHMEQFATSIQLFDRYDAFVFFAMPLVPIQRKTWYEWDEKKAIEQLLETGKGILLLHHSLFAYPGWDLWGNLVGFADRQNEHVFKPLDIRVKNRNHPILHGINDFSIIEEADSFGNPSNNVALLLSAQDQEGDTNIAWTNQYNSSKLFCLNLGHNQGTWTNPIFIELLKNGLEWITK